MNRIAKDATYVLRSLGYPYTAKYEVIWYDGENHVVTVWGLGLVAKSDEFEKYSMLENYVFVFKIIRVKQ